MDLEKMIKAHSDYSQSYPGHNKGCKICFILAEVERLKAINDRLVEMINKGEMRRYEVTQENKKLREALEPMRQLLKSLKENGSSHAFFIMQQAWGNLDWDEVVEMMDSLLEILKEGPE